MKRALISVFYKSGIESIARKLIENGWEILSTGGTSRYLRDNSLPVLEISEITRFPEILDGRVKTLHPLVFGPILAKKTSHHLEQLHQFSVPKIDLVMVNFYPFEEALQKKDQGLDFMVENIDIGGPSMVRAAAKNFKDTIVIVDREDYEPVVEKILVNGDISLVERKALAQKAFSYTSFYDSLIAGYLLEARPTDGSYSHPSVFGEKKPMQDFLPMVERFSDGFLEPRPTDGKETHPVYLNYAGRKTMDLRYGENPHQRGALYIRDGESPLNHIEILQGKELSFNNLLDLSMVYEVLNWFQPETAEPLKTAGLTEPTEITGDFFSVIVKHQNPCGAALGNSQRESYKNALAGDPKSAYGGIVGFNTPLEGETAEEMKSVFFEVIVAPAFTAEALQIFKKKKNLRLVKMPLGYWEKSDIKTVPGGFVFQDRDQRLKAYDDFELKTSRPLTEKEIRDVKLGWKLIKYVKSNAIILVKEGKLIGVGAGQMSRVDSVDIAINKSQFPVEGAVLVSDAFFPFADSVEAAGRHKIAVMVQPGGSVRDNEVIEKAEACGISLLFTGMRHFRH